MTSETFPLDSFRDAATHLRRPFTPEAVKFKMQATWPKDNPTGGLIVSYIDARLVVERLNLIIPHLWSDRYDLIGGGLMWCHLTVDGITRSDIGEGVGKGLVSDALKRAGVKFGIGVSLYAVPKMIVNAGDQAKVKGPASKKTLELTPNGETHVRNLYAGWLDVHGKHAFGDPLDHGDVEGAQGDAEADEPPEPEAAPQREPLASSEQQASIYTQADHHGIDKATLANLIKAAAGAEPVLWETKDDATAWLEKALPRLPARLLKPIGDLIAKEGTAS